ncbi:unnamed protein product [Lymnaea stagnalis]|uniref:VWFA domain-containing protein n=1 Tax=Lymnaea stagnalis TaxID=6523 RepID=A0AAV2I4F8_LYMST
MDFGSKYVLANDDEEEVSSEDEDLPMEDFSGFECEIMEFGEDDDQEQQTNIGTGKAKKPSTNVVKLDLCKLKEDPDLRLSLGDSAHCSNPKCGAFFSFIDTIYDKNWTCKFCGQVTVPKEVPKTLTDPEEKKDVSYEHTVEVNGKDKPLSTDDHKIIFVIDTSGSMGRKEKLSEDNFKKLTKTLQDLTVQDQGQTPVPKDDETYKEISWLQYVQAAIIDQIAELKDKKESRQIGLVLFSDLVIIFDGQQMKQLTEADMENERKMIDVGESYSSLHPISNTANTIIEILKKLKDGGRTALGPALLVALGMTKNSRGSKIIVCTDGAANVGVGNLEEPSDDDKKFYAKLTNKVKVAEASVSIISFNECQLNILEQLPRGTGGSVEIVKPEDFTNSLKKDLAREILATRVIVTFVVHKDFYCPVKDTSQKDRKSVEVLSIGNIYDEPHQISFKFTFGPAQQPQPQQPQPQQPPPSNTCCSQNAPKPGHGELGTPMAFDNNAVNKNATTVSDTMPEGDKKPFQIQIMFKDKKGTSYSRVWTHLQEVTTSHKEAEENKNQATTLTSFLQDSACIILKSFKESSLTAVIYKAQNILNTAYKEKDNVKEDDNVVKKLLLFIECLEELVGGGVATDAISAILSELTKA